MRNNQKLRNPDVIGKFGIGFEDALATFYRKRVKSDKQVGEWRHHHRPSGSSILLVLTSTATWDYRKAPVVNMLEELKRTHVLG